MKRLLTGGILLAATAVGLAYLWVRPSLPASPVNVEAQVRQAAATTTPDSLAAKAIPNDDLPPEGTRSLFDHLIAQNQQLPFPFEKLVDLVGKGGPAGNAPLTLLIPLGRSLLKASADYGHPRILVAADFQAPNTPASFGLAARAQIFLGFVENAHEVEVISYNEAAGRYEFQLVEDYRDGGQPKLVYARRVICETCHQGAAPIFPQRPWNETNGQPETAARIVSARGSDAAYLGVPIIAPLSNPERFEQLVDVADFVSPTQRAWIDGCRDGAPGVACRRQMLRVALRYRWSPGEFDPQDGDAQQLRRVQAIAWPPGGIAVSDGDLRNRDPIGERKGVKGFLRSVFLPQPKPGEGAKNNEDLAAFDRLPKLPADLDPTVYRPPARILNAADLDGAIGIAALLTDADFKSLETLAGFDVVRLLGAANALPEDTFAPRAFSRVRVVNALRTALGANTPLEYCCLNTADLSPPIASGIPPLAISDGSVLRRFETYCFACHRGNPSAKLNFMAGSTEAEVLSHIKDKSEIRDVLDWPRYRNTDKANTLMPPVSSTQRAALDADEAKGDKARDEMRDAVPSMFNF